VPQHVTVSARDAVAIPPARQHHLELHEAATFAVEFHRLPNMPTAEAGTESTALETEPD
jgi:hypothetical protein